MQVTIEQAIEHMTQLRRVLCSPDVKDRDRAEVLGMRSLTEETITLAIGALKFQFKPIEGIQKAKQEVFEATGKYPTDIIFDGDRPEQPEPLCDGTKGAFIGFQDPVNGPDLRCFGCGKLRSEHVEQRPEQPPQTDTTRVLISSLENQFTILKREVDLRLKAMEDVVMRLNQRYPTQQTILGPGYVQGVELPDYEDFSELDYKYEDMA